MEEVSAVVQEIIVTTEISHTKMSTFDPPAAYNIKTKFCCTRPPTSFFLLVRKPVLRVERFLTIVAV